MKSTDWMEKKIIDYKRFIMTLVILSSYLYIGTLISLYEYHSSAYIYLYGLIAVALITAFILILKVKKWKHMLREQ